MEKEQIDKNQKSVLILGDQDDWLSLNSFSSRWMLGVVPANIPTLKSIRKWKVRGFRWKKLCTLHCCEEWYLEVPKRSCWRGSKVGKWICWIGSLWNGPDDNEGLNLGPIQNKFVTLISFQVLESLDLSLPILNPNN